MLNRVAASAALALLLFAHQALAQQPVIPPSGPIADTSTASLGASSIQVVAAIPNGGKRTALFIELNTSGATIACNPNGSAAIGGAGSITISGQYASINFASLGVIPNTALQCIADSSGRSITVWAYPQ